MFIRGCQCKCLLCELAGGTAPHDIDDTNEKVKSWQEGERRGNELANVCLHTQNLQMNEWVNDGKCHGNRSLKGNRGSCQGRQNVSEVIPWKQMPFLFLEVIFQGISSSIYKKHLFGTLRERGMKQGGTWPNQYGCCSPFIKVISLTHYHSRVNNVNY